MPEQTPLAKDTFVLLSAGSTPGVLLWLCVYISYILWCGLLEQQQYLSSRQEETEQTGEEGRLCSGLHSRACGGGGWSGDGSIAVIADAKSVPGQHLKQLTALPVQCYCRFLFPAAVKLYNQACSQQTTYVKLLSYLIDTSLYPSSMITHDCVSCFVCETVSHFTSQHVIFNFMWNENF